MTISINPLNNASLYSPSTKASAPAAISTPFQKYLQSALTPAAAASSQPATVGATAEFDPFAAVRSGAVSESNSFVLALEHMYGIPEGSITGGGIQSPNKTDAPAPSKPETTTEQARIDASSNSWQTASTFSDLSKLVSNAAEQNAAALPNLGEMQAMLRKLG